MASTTRLRFAFLFTACIGVSLAGCNDGTTSGNTASSGSSTTTSTVSKTVSRISGNPPPAVVVGSASRFLPTAAAVGDATLTFSIQNQPKWTSFDSTTGLLTGTPTAGDVSTFKQIVIAVSDGATTASLTAFSISVTPATAADSVSISGSPAVSVVAGAAYSFQPTAKSAGGGTLTFAVGNLPTW